MSTAVSAPAESRYPPGDLAIWIFILAELSVFAVFFAAYAFTRMNQVALFNEYQLTLDRGAALINTLALITSSYFVVRAVAAIRGGEGRSCAGWLGLDPTAGLLVSNQHLPVARSPLPEQAAPIRGSHDGGQSEPEFRMRVRKC